MGTGFEWSGMCDRYGDFKNRELCKYCKGTGKTDGSVLIELTTEGVNNQVKKALNILKLNPSITIKAND